MARKRTTPKQDATPQDATPQDDFADFDLEVTAGDRDSRYDPAVKDRIVAYLTAKHDGKVKVGQNLPVPVILDPMPDQTDKGAGVRSNTAYDYKQAVQADLPEVAPDGWKLGTRWAKDKAGRYVLTLRVRQAK